MKKPILAASAIVVAIGVGAPKYIASQYEAKLDNILVQLNEQPGYTAKMEKLDQNWFSSDASISITLDISAFAPPEPDTELPTAISATLDVHTQYGLLLTESGLGLGLYQTHISLPATELRDILNWPEAKPFYQVDLSANLLAEIDYQDHITSFSFSAPENENTAQFSGFSGVGRWKQQHLVYQGKMDSVKFEGSETVTLENLSVNADFEVTDWQTMVEGGFYNSHMAIALESVASDMFAVKNLQFIVDSKVQPEQQTGAFYFKYAVDEITSEVFSASNLALAMQFNHLSETVMRKYQDAMKQMMKQQPTPEQMQLGIAQFVEENLPELLSKEPELNITELKGTIPQGSFDATLSTKLVDIDASAITLVELKQPEFWINHVLANASIKADQGIVELIAAQIIRKQLANNPNVAEMSAEQIEAMLAQQSPMIINGLVQQGFIQQEGNSYRCELKLQQGQASINGTPFPLLAAQ